MAEAKASGAIARAQDGRQGPDQAKVAARLGLPLSSFRVLASIAVLSAVTLTAELVLPEAIWAAALHISVVFLGVWLARARDIVLLGALASLLLVVGALAGLATTSAAGLIAALAQGPELANRLMVLLGIWAMVAVLVGAKGREAALRARLMRETARRRASESELARRQDLPRPPALAERIRDPDDLGHEVRSQLNAIVGFSDAARQEIFGPHSDPRYRDYLGHINDAGWALLKVLDRSLASEPLPETRSEPGTRRVPGAAPETLESGEADPPAHCAPKAVNQ